MSGRQTEVPVKGLLRTEVDTPFLEIGCKLLLRTPVLRIELLNVVVRNVERSGVPLGLSCAGFLFGNRVMQKAVAYEFHQPIRIYALMVFCKKMRVFLDERNDVVFLLPGWLATALPMLCDDELVAPDTLSLTVRADKRRETQTEASVLAITGIEQYIPDVEPLQKSSCVSSLSFIVFSFVVSCGVCRIVIGGNVLAVPVRVLLFWPALRELILAAWLLPRAVRSSPYSLCQRARTR